MVVSCWPVSPSHLSLLCPPLSSLSCVSPSLEQPPARPHLSLRPSSLPWWRSENNPLYHTQGLWWIGRSWGGWGGGASMPSAATRGRWEPQPEQVKTLSSPPLLSSSLPLHITLTRTNGLIGWKDRICQQLMRSASALQQTKGFSGECDWRTRRLILPSNLKIYFAIMGRYPNTSGRRNRCVVKCQCCNTIEYLRRMKVRCDKVLQLV